MCCHQDPRPRAAAFVGALLLAGVVAGGCSRGEPPLHRLASFDGEVEVQGGDRTLAGRLLFERPGADGPGTLQWLPRADQGATATNVTLLGDGRVVAFTDSRPRTATADDIAAIAVLRQVAGWERSPQEAADHGAAGYDVVAAGVAYRVRVTSRAAADPHHALR